MDGDDLAKLNDELRTPVAKQVLRLDQLEVVNKKLGEAKWELKWSIYQLVRDSSIINVKGGDFFRQVLQDPCKNSEKKTPKKSTLQSWQKSLYIRNDH